MNNKDKNILKEPELVYPIDENFSIKDEMHQVLLKLIKKSKQDFIDGKGIPHEEAMRRIKQKFPFLK